jgi:hypothetical protein
MSCVERHLLETDTPMRWFRAGNDRARAELGARPSLASISVGVRLSDHGWSTDVASPPPAFKPMSPLLPAAPLLRRRPIPIALSTWHHEPVAPPEPARLRALLLLRRRSEQAAPPHVTGARETFTFADLPRSCFGTAPCSQLMSALIVLGTSHTTSSRAAAAQIRRLP